MEINNNKEIPFEPSQMRFLPQTQDIPVYFFDDQDEGLSELREIAPR